MTEVIEIPKQYAEKIEKLAKKWDISQDELSLAFLDKYQFSRDDFKATKKELPKDMWKYAWNMVVGEMSRDFGTAQSRAPTYYVYRFGDSGIFDAIEKYHKPHSRKTKGMTLQDGTELDYREKLFGRDNPNFMHPYGPEQEFQREVYAIVSDNAEWERPNIYVIRGNGDGAKDPMDAPLHKFFKTRLNTVRAKLARPTLNMSRATRWNVIENPPYTVSELMNKIDFYEIEDALKEIAPIHATGGKAYKQPLVVVKGLVSLVGREREEKADRYITITDDLDNSILVALPKIVPFNYRSGSEVYFVGTFAKLKNREGYLMNAVGYIPGDMVVEYTQADKQVAPELELEDETEETEKDPAGLTADDIAPQ